MPVALGSTTVVVPEGYQAIIRKIELIPGVVLQNSSATGVNPLEHFLDLFVDGGGVKENTSLSIRLLSGSNTFPLFFTLPENASLKVQLRVDQNIFGAGFGFDCAVLVHGNLILSDDRPDEFIVSTLRGLVKRGYQNARERITNRFS